MSEGYAGYDAVGNSDCANVYFYDELQLLFPRAKYLWLYRSRVQVKMEMQALNLFNPRVDYALMRATDVLLEHGKTDDYNLCINYLDLDSELERIFHFLTNQSTSTMSYSVHRSDLNRLQIQIKHEGLSGLNSEKFEKLYGKRDPNVHSEVINRLVAISEPTI